MNKQRQCCVFCRTEYSHKACKFPFRRWYPPNAWVRVPLTSSVVNYIWLSPISNQGVLNSAYCYIPVVLCDIIVAPRQRTTARPRLEARPRQPPTAAAGEVAASRFQWASGLPGRSALSSNHGRTQPKMAGGGGSPRFRGAPCCWWWFGIRKRAPARKKGTFSGLPGGSCPPAPR